MKIAWKKSKAKGDHGGGGKRPRRTLNPDLPFESGDDAEEPAGETDEKKKRSPSGYRPDDVGSLVESFLSQGNQLAEDRRYHEALGKWEAALTLAPEKAILHEQKAQVLLELGDAWNALRAATEATELEPSWPEAWVTLGRAQLNFGEPDLAIESFDRALAIKGDLEEAHFDRKAAVQLVKKRKLLQASCPSVADSRCKVGDSAEMP